MSAIVPETTAQPIRLRASGKFFCDAATGETVLVKAVTYGPFPEDGEPDHEKELAIVRHDFGANAIRLYEIPTLKFLDLCTKNGLAVFLTIPWAHHVDFISDRKALLSGRRLIHKTVTTFKGHPAIAAYFVGNEIPATLVRWMGPARVRRAIELLIETGRKVDPDALFSYANYPSTEYLLPGNQDFVSFNIYLEDCDRFARYLRRLQNLAGDKPLFIAEFGLDSKANGDEKQAEVLAWHHDEICRAGLAGTTVFAWSDRWARGGEEIDGWDFGLVRRDGSQKAAFEKLAPVWKATGSPAEGLDSGKSPPRFSVIVCTYRGVRTLRRCLESLQKVRYADFEVIIVNDGADAEVAKIAGGFPEFREVPLNPHAGLSAARNAGAETADGEILVYTDDDCLADPDWLTFLAIEFDDPAIAAAGGPNLPPPPESFVQACVEASPGGPSHVLLSDREAEHIPGCNLAVRRDAFFEIGGFDPQFHTAGDDVDFCWRLRRQGFRIGFHPAAMVWHYRRFTFSAYIRQQIGYGRAEAMLIPVHPERFGSVGGARWDGFVYDAAQSTTPDAFTRIYQGVFGYAPYQMLYGGGGSSIGYVVSSFQWVALAAGLLLLGIAFPLIAALGTGMFGLTILHAVRSAHRAVIDSNYDGPLARICVGLLAFVQPLIRSFRRFVGSLPHARLPGGLPQDFKPAFFPNFPSLRRRRRFRFWSEEGKTRDDLLAVFLQSCESSGVPASTGDGWADWDVELPASNLWSMHLTTATEYHEGMNRLTRARLDARPTAVTIIFRAAIVLTAALLWKLEICELFSWPMAALAAALLLPDWIGLRLFFRIARILKVSARATELERVP